MKAENQQYLESLKPEFERLMTLCSWDNIFRTGQLKKFDAARIRDIVRQEFSPAFNTDLNDTGAVYQMILYTYRRYNEIVNN